MHTGFCLGNLREQDHLEVLGLDRTIIRIKVSLTIIWNCVDRSSLVSVRAKCRAVVNTVTSVGVPCPIGNILTG